MGKKLTVVRKTAEQEAPSGEYASAGADISKILTLKPPLDLKASEKDIAKELKELLPNIQEGDDLAVTTWNTLKKLGWKASKPEKATAAAENKASKKGGKEALAPNKRIKVLIKAEDISKRHKTLLARFPKYVSGMRVADALRKHVSEKDILWDAKEGNISLY